MVDYSKLDAALAAAMEASGAQPELTVSVRTCRPLDDAEQQEARSLGVRGVVAGRTIFSATIDRQTAIKLTEKPWVQRLSLARELRPLG